MIDKSREPKKKESLTIERENIVSRTKGETGHPRRTIETNGRKEERTEDCPWKHDSLSSGLIECSAI